MRGPGRSTRQIEPGETSCPISNCLKDCRESEAQWRFAPKPPSRSTNWSKSCSEGRAHEGGAGLEHSEHAREHLRTRVEDNPDDALATNARTDEGPGGGNAWMDFKGEKRRNDTHETTTDREAKLVRKGPGKEARLCFGGHATRENRNGLCVLFEVHPAVGAPESSVAVGQMTELYNRGFKPKTVGADKGYHTAEFVAGLREQDIVPHPARKDGQKTLHVLLTHAHAISQKLRKRIEEIFGWVKTTGGFRKSRYRGVDRSHAAGQYVVAALNLLRMAKLWVTDPPRWAQA